MSQRIVRTGKWLYDGSIYKQAFIVEAKYSPEDNMEDDEFGELTEVDAPQLHGDGLCYYVYFDEVPSELPVPAYSRGFSTVADASAHAESRAPTSIIWDSDRAA